MPLFTALTGLVVGGLGLTGTGAAIATFALRTAVSAGFSLLEQSLAGKPQSVPFSIKGRVAGGGEVPRSIIMGLRATAGSLVYHNHWGDSGTTPNARYTRVIALSDIPVDSLAGIWVNGEECTFDASPHASYGYPVLEYRKSGVDYLWIKFYDGTQTAADSFLTSKVHSADRPWTSNEIGYGIAYAIVTARINQELHPGFPEVLFEVQGAPLYDPTQDTTAGGSGAQRWATPSTWGGDGDDLPMVQVYNLLRGVSYNGAWLYGLQTGSQARLPDADWIAAIGVCRATVTGPGGSEARYRSSCELPVNAEIGTAVEHLLATCNGRISDTAGVFKPVVGAVGAAVATFTDDDILTNVAQEFRPQRMLAESVNGVTGRFPDPAQGWETRDAKPRRDTDAETLDGGRRLTADLVLDFCPYRAQVQRVMKAVLAEHRRERRHSLTLPPPFWVLEPGDVVEWTSTRHGYSAKKFIVAGIVDLPNLDVAVEIVEVDASDYDWDHATEYVAPTDGAVGRSYPAAEAVPGFAVSAVPLKDGNAVNRRPGIKIDWTAASVENARGIRWQLRRDGGTAVQDRGLFTDVDDGVGIIGPLIPACAYEVRAQVHPEDGRETTWTAWTDITTGDYRMRREDVESGEVTGRQFALANLRNLVPDGQMQDDESWTLPTGFTLAGTSSELWNSLGAILWTDSGGTGSSGNVVSSVFPVEPGGVYQCAFQTARVTGTQYRVLGRVRWLDKDGAELSFTQIANDLITSAGVQSFGDQLTAPSSARQAEFYLRINLDDTDGNVRIGGVSVEPRIVQEQILDGAVSDRTPESEAGVLSTTSTSLAQLTSGGSELSITGLTEGAVFFVGAVYELRTATASNTATAQLQMRRRSGGGSWSGYEAVPNASGNTDTTGSYVKFAETGLITAVDDEYEITLWGKTDNGAVACQARNIVLAPLVLRR